MWNFVQRGSTNPNRGITTIKRDTLIQDYPEGGMRCIDIQNFVWALYASWGPRLMSPPLSHLQNKVLEIINRTYGHLKQDFCILAGNCDFLQLPLSTSPMWKLVLQAWGKRPNIQSAKNRPLTFAELCMMPLWYNPDMPNTNNKTITIQLPSTSQLQTCNIDEQHRRRESESAKYYNFTKALATKGITHVIHVLTNIDVPTTNDPNDRKIRKATVQELKDKYAEGYGPVISRRMYEILNLPNTANETLNRVNRIREANPNLTIHELMKRDILPNTWLQWNDGVVGKLGENFYYDITPDGLLIQRKREQQRYWTPDCEPVKVYKTQKITHYQNSEERIDNDEGVLIYAGKVIDKHALFNEPKTQFIMPNLENYLISSNQTEREAKFYKLSSIDVNQLYYTRLSLSYTIPRTLDPNHIQTTLGSTKWYDLFFQGIPQTKISKIRLDIMSRAANSDLSIKARDTLYKTIHDGFLMGPERCIKKHWKGTCDACYLLKNEHVRETLKHTLTECPFYTSIMRAIFFNTIYIIDNDEDKRRILNGNEESIVKLHARELITGSTKHTKIQAIKRLNKVWPSIVGAMLDKIMCTRHQNANSDSPFQLNASDIYDSICTEIELYARTAKRKAEVKQNKLQIRYQYCPKEEESPIGKWKKEWGPLIFENNGRIRLRFKDFQDSPYLTIPQYENDANIQRRNSLRIHQANYNTQRTNSNQ